MSKLLALLSLIALLTACAASTERQEQCTPQWPPGPCADPPARSK
jgi:outer membrane biogenesis lipoprotein LolB